MTSHFYLKKMEQIKTIEKNFKEKVIWWKLFPVFIALFLYFIGVTLLSFVLMIGFSWSSPLSQWFVAILFCIVLDLVLILTVTYPYVNEKNQARKNNEIDSIYKNKLVEIAHLFPSCSSIENLIDEITRDVDKQENRIENNINLLTITLPLVIVDKISISNPTIILVAVLILFMCRSVLLDTLIYESLGKLYQKVKIINYLQDIRCYGLFEECQKRYSPKYRKRLNKCCKTFGQN